MGGEEGGERGAAEPLNFRSTEKRHPPQKFPCGRCRFRVQFRKFAGGDFKTHILTFHQGLHHISVDILTPLLPVAGHSLSLILVGDGEIEADEDRFAFPDFTVDDIVLICGFIEIGDDADLVS